MALALVTSACTGDDDASSPTSSDALINGGGPVLDGATIDGHVAPDAGDGSLADRMCAHVLDWSYELVAVVNGFTTESRTTPDANARRDAYLGAFDAALALVDELVDRLHGLPVSDDAAMGHAVALVLDASERARREVAGARAEAVGLPDAAYEIRRVRSGRLFVSSEKARSLVFGGLDTAATDESLPGLLAPCGRPQYPDT